MTTERSNIDQAQAVQMAYQYLQAGNLPQAKVCLMIKLEADPNHCDALHLFGIVSHQEGNNEIAAEYLSRAISVNPRIHFLYNTLGKIFIALKRLEEALACFQKELSLQANDDAYANLSRVLVMLDRRDEAIVNLETAVKFNPSCKLNHLDLVQSYCLARRLDALQAKFDTTVRQINDAMNSGVAGSEMLLSAKFLAEMCQIANFFLLMQVDVYQEKFALSTYQAALLIQKISSRYADSGLARMAADLLANYTEIRSRIYFFPKFPLALQIEPTNECNLACPMCPRTHDMKRQTGHLSPETWNMILDNWGKNIEFNGYLTGFRYDNVRLIKFFFLGEPLLHPKLNWFIADAKKRKITVYVQTNGVPLKSQRQRMDLLKAGPDIIGISVDGHDRKSYQIARDGAEWDKIVENVTALCAERKELGLEHDISIQVTNIIVDSKDQLERKRIFEFMQPLLAITNALNIIPLDKTHAPIYFDSKGGAVPYQKADVFTDVPSVTPSCLEPLSKLNVLRDGTITPCCIDTDGKMRLGCVDDGIDNVWNSDRAVALRKAHLTRSLEGYDYCKACLGWSQKKMTEVDSFFPQAPLR